MESFPQAFSGGRIRLEIFPNAQLSSETQALEKVQNGTLEIAKVSSAPLGMNRVEALGGAPTPIAYGELYTALQQGVVDGAENNPPSFFTSRHYEVCKNYTLDHHS